MSNKLTAFVGGSIGFGIALVLTVLGVRSWLIFLIFPLIGAIAGFVYGKRKNDKEALLKNAAKLEEEKKQRIKWAEDIKKMATSVASTCERNAGEYEALVCPTYKANSQMDEILKELANASELKGKVEAMAHDTRTKGGMSK